MKKYLKQLALSFAGATLMVAPVLAQDAPQPQSTDAGAQTQVSEPAQAGAPGQCSKTGKHHGHFRKGGKDMMDPAKRAERRKKFMEKFDENKDGVLDDSEKAKVKAFKEERRAQRAAKRKAKEEKQGAGQAAPEASPAPAPAEGGN